MLETLIKALPLILFICFPFLMFLTAYKPFIHPWYRAKVANLDIKFEDLITMWYHKTPSELMVDAAIIAQQSKIPVSLNELQAHHLAGGDVKAVLLAIRAASEENLDLTFERARVFNLMHPEGGAPAILQKARQQAANAPERLQGKTGLVVERFVPSGIVEIEGQRYDVESEAGLLDTGTKVSVVQVQGNRILVHPTPQEL